MQLDNRPLHLLVVEDNLGDFVLVEEYVDEHFSDYKLDNAKTAESAVEKLKSKKQPYDCILLDLTLPDSSGEPLIKRILDLSGYIPVIVLTGFSNLDFSIKSLSLGISDYLLKDSLSPFLLYKSIIYAVEQSRSTLQIKESEKNYRQLFELSPEPMWLFDVGTFRFLDVNRATVEQYGYTKEEFMKMSILDIRPEEERTRVTDIINDLPVDSEIISFEGEFTHEKKSGDIILVEIHTSDIRYDNKSARIVLARDITERRKEEQRLQLLESVITNSTETVIILEAKPTIYPSRKILYVNHAFTEATGYKKEEVLGKPLNFLYGAETNVKKVKEVLKSMEKWETCNAELINYKKDGTPMWVNSSFVPVVDEEGGYSHWVGVSRDVTEQKNIENKLKDSLREKEVLLSEIHHRVKNNLAVVSGMMQIQIFSESNKEVINRLQDSISRIQTMAAIHELLYESQSFSRLEFSKIIRKLIKNIDHAFNEGKEIKHEINSELVQLNINQAVPCSLIISEVLTNIYKHAFNERKKGTVSFILKKKCKKVLISVEDDGPGLPDPFNIENSGSMGMNIIRILTEQLEGKHQFNSTKNGTKFSLEFEMSELSGIANARL